MVKHMYDFKTLKSKQLKRLRIQALVQGTHIEAMQVIGEIQKHKYWIDDLYAEILSIWENESEYQKKFILYMVEKGDLTFETLYKLTYPRNPKKIFNLNPQCQEYYYEEFEMRFNMYPRTIVQVIKTLENIVNSVQGKLTKLEKQLPKLLQRYSKEVQKQRTLDQDFDLLAIPISLSEYTEGFFLGNTGQRFAGRRWNTIQELKQGIKKRQVLRTQQIKFLTNKLRYITHPDTRDALAKYKEKRPTI